ncbi:gamma-glutamyltransferase [candidate division GN15 bacterium]|nr:gamma-glutamyltransferase [candidate division GN15 bacterium]
MRNSLTCAAVAICAVAFCLGLAGGCSDVGVTRYYDRAAIACTSPAAAQIGLEVFEQGGNAFDASIAVAFALAVVYPQAGNIGGGGFAVIHDGVTGEVSALDFRETAPLAATETMYQDSLGEVIEYASLLGSKAAGVPGTVAGLRTLWEEYGSLPWEQLVRPAAVLADTGFVVDSVLAVDLATHRDQLCEFEGSCMAFFPDGELIRVGQKLQLQDLAGTLFAVAAEGAEGFYEGRTAEKLVATMERYEGLIGMEDLARYEAIWRDPVHFQFDGYDIYSMPPPSSGGIALGQILKLLEPMDFAALFPHDPQYIHLFTEAARLAYADRAKHLGDPDFYDVPVTLLEEQYLERRRQLIDSNDAVPSKNIRAGSPPVAESEETTHISVSDGDGNMVSLTYTLNTQFGCKVMVEGAGFLLNNEMDDFSAKSGVPNVYGLVGGEANKIEPGKRMLSSMSPTIVLHNGEPRLVLGTPGGSKIITTVAQALINLIRFDLEPEEIASQPRFHHQWLPDQLLLEQGAFDINTKQELINLGHMIEEREPWCDIQLIYIDDQGLMAPAADPRRNGESVGH